MNVCTCNADPHGGIPIPPKGGCPVHSLTPEEIAGRELPSLPLSPYDDADPMVDLGQMREDIGHLAGIVQILAIRLKTAEPSMFGSLLAEAERRADALRRRCLGLGD